MFFLRKKRQKRDQEAGLIFRWRGARRHHTSKILALMIATGLFAFSVYAIRIDTEQTPLVSKRTGTVFMINDDDPNCYQLLVQIEERSPFPRRWDPAYDAATMGRVSSEVSLLTGKTWSYQPELVPLPVVGEDRELPSIVEPGSALLKKDLRTWELAAADVASESPGALFVRARMSADEGIQKRLPDEDLALPRALISEDWYGQSFRFLISVGEKGVVRSCVSLSSESVESVKPSEKEKQLSVWIRGLRFKSAAGQPELRGVLELQIEALHE